MSITLRLAITALFFGAITTVQAAPRHREPACSGLFCWQPTAPAPVPHHRRRLAVGGTVLAHPAGCPARLFCGCGAAVRVFGAPVRSLWLATAWFRFPRAAPAPGRVAVRRHHVMVLEADLGGGVWQVYDANGGRGGTYVHPRSIAGYTIVNPRG